MAEDFRAIDAYFDRLRRCIKPPKLHKNQEGKPLCGIEVPEERLRKKWSSVTCKACLGMMPPETKAAIEERTEEFRTRVEETRLFNVQVDGIQKATGAARWRCEAAFKKIGDSERTTVWLRGIVEREKAKK
jgi:hypothetical protein